MTNETYYILGPPSWRRRASAPGRWRRDDHITHARVPGHRPRRPARCPADAVQIVSAFFDAALVPGLSPESNAVGSGLCSGRRRVVLAPVAGDLRARRHPDVVAGSDVVEEACEPGARPGLPMIRQCSPTDIIRPPSERSCSNASIRYVAKSPAVTKLFGRRK